MVPHFCNNLKNTRVGCAQFLLEIQFESVIINGVTKSGNVSLHNNSHLRNIYQYGYYLTNNSMVNFPEWLISKHTVPDITKGMIQSSIAFIECGSYKVI